LGWQWLSSGKEEDMVSSILSESAVEKEAPVSVLLLHITPALLAEHSKGEDELTA
jgi:hypothetical protein